MFFRLFKSIRTTATATTAATSNYISVRTNTECTAKHIDIWAAINIHRFVVIPNVRYSLNHS